MFVLVRYDATENCLVTDVSQQKRILKRRYDMQCNCYAPLPPPFYHFYLLFSPFLLKSLLIHLYLLFNLCCALLLLIFFFFFLIYCLNDACRYYLVEKAKDANIIGILVGTLGVGKFLWGIE